MTGYRGTPVYYVVHFKADTRWICLRISSACIQVCSDVLQLLRTISRQNLCVASRYCRSVHSTKTLSYYSWVWLRSLLLRPKSELHISRLHRRCLSFAFISRRTFSRSAFCVISLLFCCGWEVTPVIDWHISRSCYQLTCNRRDCCTSEWQTTNLIIKTFWPPQELSWASISNSMVSCSRTLCRCAI